jgi:hypothetical protein
MRRFSFLVALLVLTVLLPCSSARGEMVGALSVEWLTCSSDVVVVGKVSEISTSRGPGDVVYEDTTVTVSKVIRGKVEGKTLSFVLRTLQTLPTSKQWMKPKEGVLFFLSYSKGHGAEKKLDGRLVPTSNQCPLSIIDLAKPTKWIVGIGSKQLKDKKSIMAAVKTAAKALDEKKAQDKSFRLKHKAVSVPHDSKVFQALWAGSGVILTVPEFMVTGKK